MRTLHLPPTMKERTITARKPNPPAMSLAKIMGQWATYQATLLKYEKRLHRKCRHCRAKFKADRADARFCSNACRQASYRRRAMRNTCGMRDSK